MLIHYVVKLLNPLAVELVQQDFQFHFHFHVFLRLWYFFTKSLRSAAVWYMDYVCMRRFHRRNASQFVWYTNKSKSIKINNWTGHDKFLVEIISIWETVPWWAHRPYEQMERISSLIVYAIMPSLHFSSFIFKLSMIFARVSVTFFFVAFSRFDCKKLLMRFDVYVLIRINQLTIMILELVKYK